MADSQINLNSVQINIYFSKLKPLQSLASVDRILFFGGKRGAKSYFHETLTLF